MSFSPLATEIQIYPHGIREGYSIRVSEDRSDGRVQAIITHKNPKGNYGFALDLSYKTRFIDTADGDMNIAFDGIIINKASTWFDKTSISESVDYQMGNSDWDLITPALRELIKKKIRHYDIKTCLPASIFQDQASESADDEQSIEHLTLDYEAESFNINLNDESGDGFVSVEIDENIGFFAEFEASYNRDRKPAAFFDGKLVTPKTDELINIKITNLKYSEFHNYAEREYDFEYDVAAADVVLIENLIIQRIKEAHEEEAYPISRHHPLIG